MAAALAVERKRNLLTTLNYTGKVRKTQTFHSFK